jgi:hypothetical protein
MSLTPNEVDAESLTPPPPTPKAQSEEARTLQEVESNLGSTIDLVTQGIQRSGMVVLCYLDPLCS